VALIEDCEMRDIYEPELSGLFKHSLVIEVIIQANLPTLHARLCEHNIRANVYASEWIFGLFASVIPCDYMGEFFDHFFKHKWIFFYQLILSLLKKHENEIVNEEDFYHFMRSIKVQQYQKSGLDFAGTTVHSVGPSGHRVESSILTSTGNRELHLLHSEGAIREQDLLEESKG